MAVERHQGGDDWVGRLVDDRYRILRLVAKGGVGSVYLADQVRMGREVAIKVLSESVEPDHPSAERFRREARAASALRNRCTVAVYDFGHTGEGHLYLVMEYVPGGSLADALQRSVSVSVPRAIRLAMDICESLAEAHENSIVHRDIKPENILLDRDPSVGERAKLADFGVVSLGNSNKSPSLTATGAFVGTPFYSSPEQVLSQPVDARTDLYALGAVLYRMLAGAPPFSADTPIATLMHHVQTPAPVVHRTAAGDPVPFGLRDLVTQLLQKDPIDRPSTAVEVRKRLRRVLTSLDEESGPIHRPANVSRTTATGETIDTDPGGPPPNEPSRPPDAAGEVIGRQNDLSALESMLAGDARLITLCGVGGVGKTRLASALWASDAVIERWADERHFVDLTPAYSLADVCRVTAASLGLAPPTELDAARQSSRVQQAMATRGPWFIVFDNLEQVDGPARQALQRWLTAAPGSAFIVTSREPLELPSEQVFELSPLSLTAASELFRRRARARHRRFQVDAKNRPLIEEICRRLDCLPLAIELAATWIPLLSPKALLKRLDQRFKLLSTSGGSSQTSVKQRTMLGVLEQSWELLSPWERRALAQIAIFHGGFDLEAAEALVEWGQEWAGASGSTGGHFETWESEHAPLESLGGETPPWLLEVLKQLRSKCLLIYAKDGGEETRFTMYESIRHFALDKLEATGQLDATRDRHAAYFRELASEMGGNLDGPDGAEVLATVRRETTNLKSAVEHALERDPVTALEIVGILDASRRSTALTTAELQSMLDRAIEQAQAGGDFDDHNGALARALELRARARWQSADTQSVHGDLEVALNLARELGDVNREASVLRHMGQIEAMRGSAERAIEFLEQSRELYETMPSPEAEAGLCCVYIDLGIRASLMNEIGQAREYHGQALELAREVNNRRVEAAALANLAGLDVGEGRLERAETSFAQALEIFTEFGDMASQGSLLVHLAGLQTECGRAHEARRTLERAIELTHRSGFAVFEGHGYRLLGLLELEAEQFIKAESNFRRAARVHGKAGNERLVAYTTLGRAYAAGAQGKLARALDLARDAARALEDAKDPTMTNEARAAAAIFAARNGRPVEARETLAKIDESLLGWKDRSLYDIAAAESALSTAIEGAPDSTAIESASGLVNRLRYTDAIEDEPAVERSLVVRMATANLAALVRSLRAKPAERES